MVDRICSAGTLGGATEVITGPLLIISSYSQVLEYLFGANLYRQLGVQPFKDLHR